MGEKSPIFSKNPEEKVIKMKEYLYVGHYTDENGNYILKVGTTNDLERRRKEHNRAYLRSAHNRMPSGNTFEYLWSCPLSKYNTLRYEDKTKEAWKAANIGEYVNNDRFVLSNVPNFVEIKIRKIYQIALI